MSPLPTLLITLCLLGLLATALLYISKKGTHYLAFLTCCREKRTQPDVEKQAGSQAAASRERENEQEQDQEHENEKEHGKEKGQEKEQIHAQWTRLQTGAVGDVDPMTHAQGHVQEQGQGHARGNVISPYAQAYTKPKRIHGTTGEGEGFEDVDLGCGDERRR